MVVVAIAKVALKETAKLGDGRHKSPRLVQESSFDTTMIKGTSMDRHGHKPELPHEFFHDVEVPEEVSRWPFKNYVAPQRYDFLGNDDCVRQHVSEQIPELN